MTKKMLILLTGFNFIFGMDVEQEIQVKTDSSSLTPLMKAIVDNDNNKALELIGSGVGINEVMLNGKTALYLAIESQNLALVKELINKGADVNIKTKYYRVTPLMTAARSGNIEIAKALLDAGALPQSRDRYKNTAHDSAYTQEMKDLIPCPLECAIL